MRTIRLIIEYDGTRYAGWQIQPHKKTIQGCLQDVLRRVTQEKVDVIGASRTDSGVHALAQVAHVKTRSKIPCGKLLTALNGLLPEDISVKEVAEAKPAFHAQKRVKKKTYRYLIWNRRFRSALLKDRAWHVWAPLDLRAMRAAARRLAGRHDFSAFRGRLSGTKTSVRTIHDLRIRKSDPIRIEIAGNGFLKYMVRNIVGTLVEVGKGRILPREMRKILRSKDRTKAGMTAPALGLYLVSIDYRLSSFVANRL